MTQSTARNTGIPQGSDISAAPSPPRAGEGVNLADQIANWRSELLNSATHSPLGDINLLGKDLLVLSAAHPSGIAQLFAGKPTTLSNLVRQGGPLSTARRETRRVFELAAEHTEQTGVPCTYLAIGVATWLAPTDANPHAVMRTPVLLRPVAITALPGSEYEFQLDDNLQINPVLVAELRSRGSLLAPQKVADSAFGPDGFDPRPALDRLRGLGGAVLPDFELDQRVVLGTFANPGQTLVDDLDRLADSFQNNDVIAALAGSETARAALRRPVPVAQDRDRDPDLERGIGDLDTSAEHILDLVAARIDLFVHAPTGTSTAQLVAALLADAAASNRTVIYTPGHRRGAERVAAQFSAAKLDQLLIEILPEPDWRTKLAKRLAAALRLQPRMVDVDAIAEVRTNLLRHREGLRAYVAALHRPVAPWNVSANDALQALAQLTATRPGPRTAVRLSTEVTAGLDLAKRIKIEADLVRYAELGGFTVQPGQTPWYGADITSEDTAEQVVSAIDRLLFTELPVLEQRTVQVATDTGIKQARTLGDWSVQLRMLAGIRRCLDIFQPVIFERSVADMVSATAPKPRRAESGTDLPNSVRRRLTKQAGDLLRPSVKVPDLHEALQEVHTQQRNWQEYCPSGNWPRVPDGLRRITEEFDAVSADIALVSAALQGTALGADLENLTIAELTRRLQRLRDGASALRELPERTRIQRDLVAAGLGELLQDLTNRRVTDAVAPLELQLAWWSRVFEQLVGQDPILSAYDGAALNQLTAQYRRLDLDHRRSLAAPVYAGALDSIRAAVANRPEPARVLERELDSERFTTLRDLVERFGELPLKLLPAIIATAPMIPQLLPPRRSVDLLILDAVEQYDTVSLLSALGRARQVVVIGDAVAAGGTALAQLAQVLPTAELSTDQRTCDPYLTDFMARNGYGTVLRPVPLPNTKPLVTFQAVAGTGIMDPQTGTAPAPVAEVEAAVEAVLGHLADRPESSLAVVTGSAVHAQRISEELEVLARSNPAVRRLLESTGPESFVVTDLTGTVGLQRDSVIFSLGFGRTPHGRVLHRFGALNKPEGGGLLLAALGAVRRDLTVITSVRESELDGERLRTPGAQLLGRFLRFAELRAAGAQAEQLYPDEAETRRPLPGRLILELADELWRAGYLVEVDYGIGSGLHIPLVVGHPAFAGEFQVAVTTDDQAYLEQQSIRVRDRLLPQRLSDVGWHVTQAWTAASFLDVQGEAQRIAELVQRAVADRLPSTEVPDRAPEIIDDLPPVVETVPPQAVTSPLPIVEAEILTEMEVATEPIVEAEIVAEPRVASATESDPAAAAAPVAEVISEPAPAAARESDAVVDIPADDVVVFPEDAGLAEPEASLETAAAEPTAPAAEFDPTAPEQLSFDLLITRPGIKPGQPIRAYTDDQLDELANWLLLDGHKRTVEQLVEELRDDLQITRKSKRVELALTAAATRALQS